MASPTIPELTEALMVSWQRDTAYNPDDWSIYNPARGQCVVSSLVVQDYFEGDLRRYAVSGEDIDETHYVNVLPDGSELDTTISQYDEWLVEKRLKLFSVGQYSSLREKCLADDDTFRRYKLLARRVIRELQEN